MQPLRAILCNLEELYYAICKSNIMQPIREYCVTGKAILSKERTDYAPRETVVQPDNRDKGHICIRSTIYTFSVVQVCIILNYKTNVTYDAMPRKTKPTSPFMEFVSNVEDTLHIKRPRKAFTAASTLWGHLTDQEREPFFRHVAAKRRITEKQLATSRACVGYYYKREDRKRCIANDCQAATERTLTIECAVERMLTSVSVNNRFCIMILKYFTSYAYAHRMICKHIV